MTELSRRGFLKACGLVTAGVLIAPSLRLIVPDQSLLADESWLATVREMYQYDLMNDRYVGRMDVLTTSGEQFGVDYIVGEMPNAQSIQRIREPAWRVLKDYLEHEGLSLKDLRPAPIPAGYEAPSWARAA